MDESTIIPFDVTRFTTDDLGRYTDGDQDAARSNYQILALALRNGWLYESGRERTAMWKVHDWYPGLYGGTIVGAVCVGDAEMDALELIHITQHTHVPDALAYLLSLCEPDVTWIWDAHHALKLVPVNQA